MSSNLVPHTIDSHFHILEMERKGMDVPAMLKNSFLNGLSYALDVAVSEEGFGKRISYKKDFPQLFFAAGIHPSSVNDIETQIASVENQIDSCSDVRAIGETGIDLFRDSTPLDKQRESFIAHIDLASKKNLPLIIHSREADNEIKDILQEYSLSLTQNIPGVFHCFSSDYKMAQFALDKGFFISFAGNVTYKKSEEIRNVARRIPIESILVETDSPYLSPQKVRGSLNHPGHLEYTLPFIAELKGLEPEVLALQIENNFLRFLSI